MKKLAFTLIAALGLWQTVHAAELKWSTNLPKALETAKADKKIVMIDFTGSDWCGFCIKLNKEVFSTTEFATYAGKQLVLVEADFPHGKKLAPELKKANEKLKDQYEIEGFPTLVFLDGEGKVLGKQVGYLPGGPKAMIALIEKLRTKS